MIKEKYFNQLKFNKDFTKVFVYFLNMRSYTLDITQLSEFLSSEEKDKANNYYTNDLKKKYVISHGSLRFILSFYLDKTPQDIVFEYELYGKPYLKNSDIYFNMSHSQDIVCYAIALNYKVGIDIELLDNNLDVNHIARLVFSPKEYSFFINLNSHEKLDFFYYLWTKKESLVKANGKGLIYGINKIEAMNLDKINLFDKENDSKQVFYYFPLTVFPDYYCALSIEYPINKIIYIEMQNGVFSKTKSSLYRNSTPQKPEYGKIF